MSPTSGAKTKDLRRSLRDAARDAFGWTSLRAGQLEAMEQVLRGRDVLAVMPTGHGKSAIYQVPATLLDGPTVVVSPLIALQRDQIMGIDGAAGLPEAVAVNSAQGSKDTEHAWDAVRHGTAEYLFLAPEQLARTRWCSCCRRPLQPLRGGRGTLHLLVGTRLPARHLRLGTVLERLGRPPVVALTATASPPVREEIIERLNLRDPRVIAQGFDRPNIRLEVERHVEDDKRAAVVERVAGLEGSGLLYVATRKDTLRYAGELAERRRRTAAYHAGLKATERKEVHERFRSGGLDVVVAASAFGMGTTSRTSASSCTRRHRGHSTATTRRSVGVAATGSRPSPRCSTGRTSPSNGSSARVGPTTGSSVGSSRPSGTPAAPSG